MSSDKSNDSDLPDRRRPPHFSGVDTGSHSSIFFLTVCTKDRRPCLGIPESCAQTLLLEAWKRADSYLVGRYVIMPDHVHLFCAPATWPAESLSRWTAFWKSMVARRWPDRTIGKLWQRDYWDTQLREGESYGEKWNYVRMNPVRAGLAREPGDWSFQGEINVLRWHE